MQLLPFWHSERTPRQHRAPCTTVGLIVPCWFNSNPESGLADHRQVWTPNSPQADGAANNSFGVPAVHAPIGVRRKKSVRTRLSATTPRPSWPVTSWWRSQLVYACGMYSYLGAGKSSHSALQCHSPSQGRLDPAAVLRSYSSDHVY
jgi:hypothetical protein